MKLLEKAVPVAGQQAVRIRLRGLVSPGLVARTAAGALVLVLAGWFGARAVDRWEHPIPTNAQVARLKAQAPPGMVLVPGGWFRMGSDQEDADPGSAGEREVYLPSYYIDRYPVTNAEYARYDPRYHYPKGRPDFPITNVTWSQAAAYLKSQGKLLPTEAEWEKAARGPDGRPFPWGNHPGHWLDATMRRRAFRSVQGYHQPPSPYGVEDSVGTVWQWVRDNVQQDPKRQVIRGGAAGYGLSNDTTYARGLEGVGDT